MSLTTFSWMMHGNDEGLVDDKRQISVNWVMPTGTFTEDDAPKDAQTVIDTVGSLLWPWQMRITGWAWVINNRFIPVTAIPTNTLADPQALQGKMTNEITQKCCRCQQPFSTDIAQAQASSGEISLPHLFAPLTLLPAGVSRDMLGMIRSLTVDDAGLPEACAPEFTITHKDQNIVFSPVSADTEADEKDDTENKIVTIGYEAKTEKDKQPYAGFPAFTVVMKKIKPAANVTLTPTLQSAERTETGMRAWLADAVLAPLPMLAQVLTDNTNNEWTIGVQIHQLLNRTLGPGYLRSDTSKKPIQYFWFWDRLQESNPVIVPLTDWDDNTRVWETLQQAIHNAGAGEHRLLQPLVDPGINTLSDFTLIAGMMLSRAEGRRILMTSWLAAVAVSFQQPNDNKPILGFVEWYQLISRHYADHSIAELQVRWWFYHLSEKAPEATETLRTGIGFWIAGDMSPQVAVLSDRYQEMLALLVECQKPATQHSSISKAFQTLQQHMQLPGTQEVVSLGEERDLAVQICSPDGAYDDRDIRGYAVAMAMGKDKIEPKLGCAWLTDTALNLQGKWLPQVQGKGSIRRFNDTVGATVQNGRKVVAFAYSGAPLSGAVSLKDGVDCLDFGWPNDPQENADRYISPWHLPPLAYGFRYWVTGTAIGNGGLILQKNFHRDDNPCELKEASQLNFLPGEGYLYLCRVAPGAVTVESAEKGIDPWLMEGESRAWHQQGLAADRERPPVKVNEQPKVADGKRPRVVVICDGNNGWNNRALTSATLTLTPPDATEQVLTKWMEADICLELLKPDLGKSAALRALRTTLLNKLRKTAENQPEDKVFLPRHPAVKAIGVRVKFDEGPEVNYIVTPEYLTARGFLTPATLRVEAGSKSQVRAGAGTDTIALTLKPGTIATVTLWSLIPKEFFTPGPDMRMADFAIEKDTATQPVWNDGPYRGFSPVMHLFECLPEAKNQLMETRQTLADIQKALSFQWQASDTVAHLAAEEAFDANWLKGFLVQRHEWHWTGYPLALPKRLDDNIQLEQWADAFSGTSSLRETQNHILQTSRAAKPADWHFGSLAEPEILCRLRLQGYHGARFFACVMRPILRYRSWLDSKAVRELENTIVAKGTVVPARINWNDPSLRLGPPIVQDAIPLVRTVMVQEKDNHAEIRTSANGALICLNDALCRTDALTQYSGVGETFDIDLEATRYVTVNEIGPNPIFHPGPGEDEAKTQTLYLPDSSWFTQLGEPIKPVPEMHWGIEVDRPFGLTFDTDSNAKVVQTALIVRPTGHDVFAYWIMAKIRLRRMLDPHEKWTLSDELPFSEDRQSWLLGRREEGDDRVPFDFVIELPPATEFILSLHSSEGKQIKTQGDEKDSRRLLCSWHKGQWGKTAEIFWGLQVLDQVMAARRSQWTTIKRYSPWETTDATAGLPIKSTLPVTLRKAANCKARRLLLSDYGESHWLTFIGMPYRHLAITRESLRMSIENEYDHKQKNNEHAITLTRSSVVQASEKISRDLLIEPLEPIEKTGTGEPPCIKPGGGTFHLLLVFEPVNDVAAPMPSQQLGRLTGVYYPQRDPITAGTRYPQLRFHSYMADSPIKDKLPDGAIGYIYKFQYTDCLPTDWTALQAQLFPERNADGSGEEAKVRWLPEIIGPISTAQLPVHNGNWPKPNVTLKRKEGKEKSVILNVDEDRGWRCQQIKGKEPEAFDTLSWANDLPGGLCTVLEGDKLALVGSGGRLIAMFSDWSQKTGDVQTYDSEGKLRSERWGWSRIA